MATASALVWLRTHTTLRRWPPCRPRPRPRLRLRECAVTGSVETRTQGVGAVTWTVTDLEIRAAYAAVPKPLGAVRLALVTADRERVRAVLAATDWYIVRRADSGEAVPDTVQAMRAEIRAKQNAREAWIDAAGAPALDSLDGLPAWPSCMGRSSPWT